MSALLLPCFANCITLILEHVFGYFWITLLFLSDVQSISLKSHVANSSKVCTLLSNV